MQDKIDHKKINGNDYYDYQNEYAIFSEPSCVKSIPEKIKCRIVNAIA